MSINTDSDAVSRGDSGADSGGRPAPRKRGRLVKALALFVGLAIALVALAPTLCGGLVRGRVESAAAEALESRVSIGGLALGWTSGLEVTDVRVEPGKPGAPGISVGSISGKPVLAALLRGRVEVPDLVIRRVVLDVTAKPKRPDEPDEDEDEPEGSPLAAIPSFGIRATIDDLTVAYREPGWDRPVRIERVGPVSINASSDDATHVDVVHGSALSIALDIQWARDGKKLRRRDRSVSGTVKLDRVELASFLSAAAPWLDALRGVADGSVRFETAGKSIATSGSLVFSGVSARLRGQAEPHRLGDLKVEHDLRRDMGGRAWDGSVDLAANRADLAPLSPGGEALVIESISLKSRLSGNIRVAIEHFAVLSDFGSIEGSGHVASGTEPTSAGGDVVARASLDKLGRWLGGLPAMTGSVASRAALTLDPDGTIKARGATTVTNFRAADVPGVGSLDEREIVVKHDLDWGGDVLSMHDVGLTSSFATARCSGSLQPRTGSGAVEGRVDLQVAANLDVIAGLLGDHLALKPRGKLSAQVSVTGADDGMAFDIGLSGESLGMSGGPFQSQPLDLGGLRGGFSGRISADRKDLRGASWTLKTRLGDLGGQIEATGLDRPHPAVTASVRGDVDADTILAAIGSTALKTPVGRVRATADVRGGDTAWAVKVTKLDALGLSAFGDATFPHSDVRSGAAPFSVKVSGVVDQVAAAFAEGWTVKGPIDADVTGTFGQRLAFDVRAKAQKLVFRGDDRRTLSGDLTVLASGTFDPATASVDLPKFSATGPGATLSGRIRLQPGNSATFDVRSDVTAADASPLLALLAPSVQASGKGILRANGELALMPGAPRSASRGTLDLEVDGLRTDALDLRDVSIEAVLDEGVARTKRATAGLNGGSAHLDATVDLRPALPQWKVNARLQDVRITKEMQPAIARAIPVFAGLSVTVGGSVGSTIDVSGRGQTWEEAKPTLTGTGQLAVAGPRMSKGEILDVVGQFVGIPPEVAFDDFQTTFRIENGAVRQDRLVLSSSSVDLSMSGTTSFEGRLNYEIGAKAKGGNSDKWRRLGPLLDREGFLAMRLSGDVRKPSLKPPKIEKVLEGAVDDILKGGLDDLFKKKKKKKDG